VLYYNSLHNRYVNEHPYVLLLPDPDLPLLPDELLDDDHSPVEYIFDEESAHAALHRYVCIIY